MFATFGDISFEVISSPVEFEEDRGYHYAEIPLVAAKPVLQWIYDDLRKVKVVVEMHQMWCDPSAELNNLIAQAEAHTPANWVWANGHNLGMFVIEGERGLKIIQKWQADDGTIIYVRVEMHLEEWANSVPIGTSGSTTTAPAVQGQAPPGSSALYASNATIGQAAPTLNFQTVPLSNIIRAAV